MSGRSERALLWIDDDGPDRFPYEEYMLAESGWKVVWATSVRDALKKLSEDRFDAILLDQMLPVDPGPLAPADVWSGCLLLYWLRDLTRPAAAPQAETPNVYGDGDPLEANRKAKVVIVSAFHDDEVEGAINAADNTIQIVKKPVDLELLNAAIGSGERDV